MMTVAHSVCVSYHCTHLSCQALRVSMEEQRARQERDAREAVTASVTESTNVTTGETGVSVKQAGFYDTCYVTSAFYCMQCSL